RRALAVEIDDNVDVGFLGGALHRGFAHWITFRKSRRVLSGLPPLRHSRLFLSLSRLPRPFATTPEAAYMMRIRFSFEAPCHPPKAPRGSVPRGTAPPY